MSNDGLQYRCRKSISESNTDRLVCIPLDSATKTELLPQVVTLSIADVHLLPQLCKGSNQVRVNN